MEVQLEIFSKNVTEEEMKKNQVRTAYFKVNYFSLFLIIFFLIALIFIIYRMTLKDKLIRHPSARSQKKLYEKR